MAELEQLDGKVYRPVGMCIYCDSKESLTDEHIIPLALGGTARLPKSSCRNCAKITGKFEQSVLRGVLWPIRVATKMPSRTEHSEAPQSRTIEVTDAAGVVSQREVAFGEMPFTVTFPLLSPTPRHQMAGVRVGGVATYSIGGSVEDLLAKLGVKSIKVSEKLDPTSFARMLAKIAYAGAVAQGARFVGKPYVLPGIRGESEDIGKWVITLPKPYEKHPGHLHRVSFHKERFGIRPEPDYVAEVQLWSNYGTPHYGVILGQAPP